MFDKIVSLKEGYKDLVRALYQVSDKGKIAGKVFVGVTKETDEWPEEPLEVEVISCFPGTQYHLMGDYKRYAYFTRKCTINDITTWLRWNRLPGEGEEEKEGRL